MVHLVVSILILCVLCLTSHAGESAGGCVTASWDGDVPVIHNTCSRQITVAYCAHGGSRYSKKGCAHGTSSWNPYYSHMTRLEAGESDRLLHMRGGSSLEYAACYGFIHQWDAQDKFSSTMTGAYSCDD